MGFPWFAVGTSCRSTHFIGPAPACQPPGGDEEASMVEGGAARPRTPSTRLDGKVAVITGAGRGLGRACALALADAGAEAVLVSRTRTDLETVGREIAAAGGRARPLVCDVTDGDQVGRTIGRLDRIDILINNAGLNIPEPFVAVSEDHYDRIMAINVRAAFFVSQAAARIMIARGEGGAIVNMSSQMGHVGAPNRAVYCASKHALEGLTKAMAVELAPHRIRVNSIGPTFILTPMTRPFFENKAFRDDTLGRIPLGELGQLEDIMGAVVFLSSPAARLITGASLAVDGGWTAH
jgi:NAD(P)-dependent dehydrogenase (short-subunit alcohol dehydrogenase family)